MPVDLSIKHVPDQLAERLRHLAARNHRSLQGELLSMLEEHLAGKSEALTLGQALAATRGTGLETPSESVSMIRDDRDAGARTRRRTT
jgi:plasmid stability protein